VCTVNYTIAAITILLLPYAPAPFDKPISKPIPLPNFVGLWQCGDDSIEVLPDGSYAVGWGESPRNRDYYRWKRRGNEALFYYNRYPNDLSWLGRIRNNKLLLWGQSYNRVR
jgi:hypothetical protein